MPIETPQGMVSRTPPSSSAKRDAFALRFEVPDGVFERGLGHGVAAHLLEDARALAAVLGRFGAASMGPSSLTSTCQAVSVDSPEK